MNAFQLGAFPIDIETCEAYYDLYGYLKPAQQCTLRKFRPDYLSITLTIQMDN